MQNIGVILHERLSGNIAAVALLSYGESDHLHLWVGQQLDHLSCT